MSEWNEAAELRAAIRVAGWRPVYRIEAGGYVLEPLPTGGVARALNRELERLSRASAGEIGLRVKVDRTAIGRALDHQEAQDRSPARRMAGTGLYGEGGPL